MTSVLRSENGKLTKLQERPHVQIERHKRERRGTG